MGDMTGNDMNANGNSTWDTILAQLVSLLTGKGTSATGDNQAQPQATPQPTPMASPMPTATPTNSQVLQRMGGPQASPTPGPQAGMHPMQQLQMAKANLPQGMGGMGSGTGKPGMNHIAPDYMGSNDSGNYQQPWGNEPNQSDQTNPMFKLEAEKGALAKAKMKPMQKPMGRA